MDYYEELGITPSATAEEVHRAHRRLSKLLHPDQQTDEDVKLLAETQMRRLNAIVEILSDPERRRQYDEQIMGNVLPPSPVVQKPRWVKVPRSQRFTWHSVPWWVASTVGAVVLTVGAAWYWADNLGSSFRNNNTEVYVRAPAQDTLTQAKAPITATPAPSTKSVAPLNSPRAPREKPPSGLGRISSRIREAILPARSIPKHRDVQPGSTSKTVAKYQDSRAPLQPRAPLSASPVPTPPPNTPPSAEAPRQFDGHSALLTSTPLVRPVARNVQVPDPPKVPVNGAPRIEAASVPLPALPRAAPPPKANEPVLAAKANVPTTAPPPKPDGLAPTPKATYQHPFEGEWVYAPKEPEKRKPGLYPPEFINLKLVWTEGGLHGQYRARYHVTDKPISPDVSFVISPSDSESRKFVWQGSDGSRGTFRINPVDSGTIRVEWRTTVFSPQAGLTAGTAVLVRHSP